MVCGDGGGAKEIGDAGGAIGVGAATDDVGAEGVLATGAGRLGATGGTINRGGAGVAVGAAGAGTGGLITGAAGLASCGGGVAALGGATGAAAPPCCLPMIAFSTSPGREMCDKSIFVLMPSGSVRAERADLAAAPSPEPRSLTRTLSASFSSRELECVFFSVTPTSVNTSRIALLLTSSSRARSLIRTLLIRLFVPPNLLSNSSCQPLGISGQWAVVSCQCCAATRARVIPFVPQLRVLPLRVPSQAPALTALPRLRTQALRLRERRLLPRRRFLPPRPPQAL